MVDLQSQYNKELKSLFAENGITSDFMIIDRLAYFASLVSLKNDSINLISRKDINSIIENHVFISSYIANYIPDKCSTFLDIGIGGGFPGIPLSIMRPEMSGVLIDSTRKKIDAVKEFINKLKLNNVKAINDRVESPQVINAYTNYFDLVVSRSALPLIILLRYALPLIKEKAFLATLKGGNLDLEFQKAEMKYKSYIKKSTIFELYYKPSNVRNQKGKKLILLELRK